MSRVNFDRNRDEDMGSISPEIGAERRFRLVVEAAPNAIVMVKEPLIYSPFLSIL